MGDLFWFDAEIAKMVGSTAAALFARIAFWVDYNEKNNNNFFAGQWWAYNSMRAWQEMCPWLTENQIRSALEKLKEADLIVTGCFNTNPFDRSLWYSLSEKGDRFVKKHKSDLGKKANVNNYIPSNSCIANRIEPDKDNTSVSEGSNKLSPSSTDEACTRENTPKIKAPSKITRESIAKCLTAEGLEASDDLLDSILGWKEFRDKARKPLTERALKLAVKKAKKLAEEDPSHSIAEIFDQSTLRSWTGVFKVQEDFDKSKGLTQDDYNKARLWGKFVDHQEGYTFTSEKGEL